MFVFGHLGIGSKIVSPWSKGLSYRLVLLGALLPDLVDKSLYYGLSAATGKHAAELGLICGTRTFAHTAIVLIALALLVFANRSKALAAIALGWASHLLLDNLQDLFLHQTHSLTFLSDSTQSPLLWPFSGSSFPVMPFQDFHQHMGSVVHPFLIAAEIVGFLLLAWDGWKNRHQSEIIDRGSLRALRKAK
jgi:hypothetical protein